MIKVIKDDIEINTLLCTRDGTKVGNAIVVGKDYRHKEVNYHCITDYGTPVILNRMEIEELFITKGLCCDDHKHRNMFYPGNGYDFVELREEDYINFDPNA